MWEEIWILRTLIHVMVENSWHSQRVWTLITVVIEVIQRKIGKKVKSSSHHDSYTRKLFSSFLVFSCHSPLLVHRQGEKQKRDRRWMRPTALSITSVQLIIFFKSWITLRSRSSSSNSNWLKIQEQIHKIDTRSKELAFWIQLFSNVLSSKSFPMEWKRKDKHHKRKLKNDRKISRSFLF